jgi:hypothetical protein
MRETGGVPAKYAFDSIPLHNTAARIETSPRRRRAMESNDKKEDDRTESA